MEIERKRESGWMRSVPLVIICIQYQSATCYSKMWTKSKWTFSPSLSTFLGPDPCPHTVPCSSPLYIYIFRMAPHQPSVPDWALTPAHKQFPQFSSSSAPGINNFNVEGNMKYLFWIKMLFPMVCLLSNHQTVLIYSHSIMKQRINLTDNSFEISYS